MIFTTYPPQPSASLKRSNSCCRQLSIPACRELKKQQICVRYILPIPHHQMDHSQKPQEGSYKFSEIVVQCTPITHLSLHSQHIRSVLTMSCSRALATAPRMRFDCSMMYAAAAVSISNVMREPAFLGAGDRGGWGWGGGGVQHGK